RSRASCSSRVVRRPRAPRSAGAATAAPGERLRPPPERPAPPRSRPTCPPRPSRLASPAGPARGEAVTGRPQSSARPAGHRRQPRGARSSRRRIGTPHTGPLPRGRDHIRTIHRSCRARTSPGSRGHSRGGSGTRRCRPSPSLSPCPNGAPRRVGPTVRRCRSRPAPTSRRPARAAWRLSAPECRGRRAAPVPDPDRPQFSPRRNTPVLGNVLKHRNAGAALATPTRTPDTRGHHEHRNRARAECRHPPLGRGLRTGRLARARPEGGAGRRLPAYGLLAPRARPTQRRRNRPAPRLVRALRERPPYGKGPRAVPPRGGGLVCPERRRTARLARDREPGGALPDAAGGRGRRYRRGPNQVALVRAGALRSGTGYHLPRHLSRGTGAAGQGTAGGSRVDVMKGCLELWPVAIEQRELFSRPFLQGPHASLADPAGGNGHDPRRDPRAAPERVLGADHRRDRGQPARPRRTRGEDRAGGG